MSLILDALNRSRQDTEPVPGLATHHPVESVTPPGRQWLPWAALAVALGLIAWLLLERGEDAPAVSPEVEVVAPVPGIVRDTGAEASVVGAQFESRKGFRREVSTTGNGQPSQAGAVRGNAAGLDAQGPSQPLATPSAPAARVAASDAVEQLYRQREAAPPDSPSAQPAAAPAVPSPQPARREQEQTQAQQPVDDANPAQRDEESVDIERMLAEAREEMKNSDLEEHPAPFIANLSQNTKDAIPTVLYQRHDYTGRAGRSSVVLNGKSLGVGGSPAPGMKVDEILPDSVVLSYNGTQFRLRALNSWVNL